MFFTRALDRKEYGKMVRAIQDKLNDELDPERRRYLVVPEKKSEGGLLFKIYPGWDPENERAYKTMRHWLKKDIGVNLSPDPWPLVGISNDEIGGLDEESKYPWKGLGVSEEEALEEAGSSLDNIVKMWYYVVGDFPDGLAYSETWQSICQVREEFFKEHAPNLCADQNPPTFDLIGVKHLALPKMLIEIAVVAVF